jgi:DNA-binding GntR family transcriptional regulator
LLISKPLCPLFHFSEENKDSDGMEKLRRLSLSDDAYTSVRALFLTGTRYSPGDKISVEELSRELGVSRTPLWAAIYRLEAEGIVEIIPRVGVYLINYDPKKAIEIYLVREVLEGMAARIAAEQVTANELDALRKNIALQRGHLRKGELDQYYAAALSFHETIVAIAGNKTLERSLQSIFAQIRAMRLQRNYTPMHLPQSCDDHERLLDALERRDAATAETEMRRHIHDLTNEIRHRTMESPRAQLHRRG